MSDRTRSDRLRSHLLRTIDNDDALHGWMKLFARIDVPRTAVCPHHDAPFDYIRHAYFEPTKDVVVWAPRGGGKTKLAAVATMLDLLHKPPCAVRILGGSLDQSLKMWEHLIPDLDLWVEDLFADKRGKSKRISLSTGASAAVLTQSQRAVRGLRVQKIRCDEVEMFDPEIWEAAQLATRSDGKVSGAIDALSTAHAPGGLMTRVIENAKRTGTRVIRWCVLDVLERCPQERDCKTCPLWDECKGVAKTKCNGFFKIDDAILMKKRVGIETWNAEMLCRKPTTKGCVFPTFDVAVHVRQDDPVAERGALHSLSIDFGFANPFVCLWIEARSDANGDGSTFVFDEYVQQQRTTPEHLEHLESRPWGKIRRITCDPAGAGRNDQTGASDIQLLRQAGFTVKARKSFIVTGLDLIRAALRPAHGEPRLFIHPRCTRLIAAMQSYRYSANGGELPIKDGTHDHLIDALRYHFVNVNRSDAITDRRY